MSCDIGEVTESLENEQSIGMFGHPSLWHVLDLD